MAPKTVCNSSAPPDAPETSRSSKPAIFGVVEAEETITVIASEEDLAALEVSASEMDAAVRALVNAERELIMLAESGADPTAMKKKQLERAEASSLFERKVSPV